MRQITATEVSATNDLHHHNPAVLALALASVLRRTTGKPNGEDIGADAALLLGVMAPEEFRNGTTTPTDDEHAKRVAFGMARRAVTLAGRRHAEEARWVASLEALTDGDTDQADALAAESAEREPRLALPATPRPDAATATTNRDRITAALTVVDDSRRATLTTAVAALEDALHQHQGAKRYPTLASAAALALDITKGRAYQRLAAQVTEALADVEPYAARILTEPNEATTPEARTQPTARRTERRALPTQERTAQHTPRDRDRDALAIAATGYPEERAPYKFKRTGTEEPNTPRARESFPHLAARADAARAMLALTTKPATTTATYPGTAQEVTTTTGTQDHAARLSAARQHAADLDAHRPTWSRPQVATRRPWTAEGQATEAQAKATQHAAHLTANLERIERHAHRPDQATASRVVTKRAARTYGYDAALGYDDPALVLIHAQDGSHVATYPAATWTPAHQRMTLADLTDTSRPAPALLAEGVTSEEARAGEQAALFTPAAVVKSTSRKNKRGTTGPTVTVRLGENGTGWTPRGQATARTQEHPSTAPWTPVHAEPIDA